MTNAYLINSVYSNYVRSDFRTLADCYKTYSRYKASAYEDCLADMVAHNGSCGSIISTNTFMFTFGYTYRDAERNKHFVYITPSNRYDVIVLHR